MSGPRFDPYGAGEPVDPYAGQPQPPVPMYQPYPNPGAWEPAQYRPRSTDGIPGTLIAATIVGYFLALVMLVIGLFLLFFGAFFTDFIDADQTFSTSAAAFLLAGILEWIAAVALTGGGIAATFRRPPGLYAFLGGAGLTLALCVYWVAVFTNGFVLFWAVFFFLLAGAAGGLALPPGIRRWMTRPVPPPPPPAPYPTDAWGRPFGS